jgi:hypothetical protein
LKSHSDAHPRGTQTTPLEMAENSAAAEIAYALAVKYRLNLEVIV